MTLTAWLLGNRLLLYVFNPFTGISRLHYYRPFFYYCFATCAGYKLRDLWNHAELGSFTGSWTANNLASHDSAFIMITAA